MQKLKLENELTKSKTKLENVSPKSTFDKKQRVTPKNHSKPEKRKNAIPRNFESTLENDT